MRLGTRHGGRGPRAALTLVCASVLFAGCATKSDVRMLQQELRTLQVRQDSIFRESQRQNRQLLDTLRTSFDIQRDVRGESSHRFLQLEQNMARLEEMINQTQLLIAQLNDRLDRQAAAPVMPVPGEPGMAVPAGAAGEMYAAAMQKLAEGSIATARAAFEQILTDHPTDPVAAAAQFQLAETYAAEEDWERAIEELQKVERQWSRSDRAPAALLRAGVISQERLNELDAARSLYEQVVARYPASEEAREASRRLRSMR